MSRLACILTTIVATMGLALLVSVGTVSAADCSLTVSPRSGAPGTKFVFTGEGFQPTTLTLTRGDETPRVIAIDDTEATSFQTSLIADDSEVGRWSAVAAGCDDATSMRVTLPPTATASSVPPTRSEDTTQLAGLILLGVLFLSVIAVLLPRLTRAARSR